MKVRLTIIQLLSKIFASDSNVKFNQIAMKNFDKFLYHILIFDHKASSVGVLDILMISKTRNKLVFLIESRPNSHRLGTFQLEPCLFPIADGINSVSLFEKVVLNIDEQLIEDGGYESNIFEDYFRVATISYKDRDFAGLKQDIEQKYLHEYKREQGGLFQIFISANVAMLFRDAKQAKFLCREHLIAACVVAVPAKVVKEFREEFATGQSPYAFVQTLQLHLDQFLQISLFLVLQLGVVFFEGVIERILRNEGKKKRLGVFDEKILQVQQFILHLLSYKLLNMPFPVPSHPFVKLPQVDGEEDHVCGLPKLEPSCISIVALVVGITMPGIDFAS